MKVTVVGGSGFLGSHVADELSTAGHTVCIYDRVSSPWLRSDQRMVIGDLSDLEALTRAMAGAEVVYHFAAFADLNEAMTRPIDTVQVNVLGTVNVLEACRRNQIRRFVYASTVYVYS